MTPDQKLADLINTLEPEKKFAAEHFVKVMTHMSDEEKKYFITTWKSHTLQAVDAGLTKGKEIGRASVREEVGIKALNSVKNEVYKRLKFALDRGSGFTVEQEEMILLGADMAVEELLKPFAESGK